MSEFESFEAASKAAEESLDLLCTVESLAEKGDQVGAKKCLGAFEAYELLHLDVVRGLSDKLAAVAEGQVCRRSSSGRSFYYSSVHEAVVSLWGMATDLSAHPDFVIPADFRDWIGINTSQLRAGLLRERAKLLAEKRESGEAVWLGDGRVQIGNETITLESQPAEVLQALVELRSATKPQLQKHSGRDEPDKLLKRIVGRFPILKPHIRFPGTRGKGGYSTTITAIQPSIQPPI